MEQPGWDLNVEDGPRTARERLACFLAGIGAGAAGIYLVFVFLSMNSPNPAFRLFMNDDRWDHFLGAPLMVLNVLSTVLLMGCRPGAGWRARSWSLLIAVLVGAGFWCVEHAHFFGWDQVDHSKVQNPISALWLRGLALVRVVTLADMAALIASEPGSDSPEPLRGQTVRAAIMAFLMWTLFEVTHVDIGQAPPRWLPIRDLPSYGLLVGSVLTRAISTIMLSILCLLAFAACGRRLQEGKEAENWWQADYSGAGQGRL